MLVCLGAVTALLARTLGFEVDSFYIVISIIGGCLFLYGAIQKELYAQRRADEKAKLDA